MFPDQQSPQNQSSPGPSQQPVMQPSQPGPVAPLPRPSGWVRAWRFFDRHVLGPRGSFYRKRMIALVVLFVVAMTFVGAQRLFNVVSGSHGDTSPYSSSTSTSGSSVANSDTITSRADFTPVCEGKSMSKAPAYKTGQPPYAAAVLEQTTPGNYLSSPDATVLTNQEVGPSLAAPSAKVQVVACISRVSETPAGRTCAYNTATLPVYDAAYRLSIFTASGHKQLTSKIISSLPFAPGEDGCPQETLYDANNPKLYYPPSPQDIINNLAPFVR